MTGFFNGGNSGAILYFCMVSVHRAAVFYRIFCNSLPLQKRLPEPVNNHDVDVIILIYPAADFVHSPGPSEISHSLHQGRLRVILADMIACLQQNSGFRLISPH